MYGQYVYWRETMRPAKFLIFDSRVVLAILPVLVHMRLWTLSLAVISMFVFWWFDRKGVPADSILRFLRSWMIGKKRSARGLFEERTAIDFGFECQLYIDNLKREKLNHEKSAVAAVSSSEKISLLSRIMSIIGFGSGRTSTQPVGQSVAQPVAQPVAQSTAGLTEENEWGSIEENERGPKLDKDGTGPEGMSSPGLLKSLLMRFGLIYAGLDKRVRSVLQGTIARKVSAPSGEMDKTGEPVKSVELIRSAELVRSVNLVKSVESVGLENGEWSADVDADDEPGSSGSSGRSVLSRVGAGPVLVMRMIGQGLNFCFSRFGFKRKTGLKSDRDENNG